MEKIQFLNSILSDIGNLVLVIFGFSVTLFTVLYSFILNKREQLKEYSDEIKSGNPDLLISQRNSNAKKFIKKLAGFNRHLIIAIFVDFAVYIICILSKYLIDSLIIKGWLTKIISIATIVIVLYISIMLIVSVKDYLKITKIE